MIYATYNMLASNEACDLLQKEVQPFSRLVKEHVLREMKRHSSFGDHMLWHSRHPSEVDGYSIIIWEAVSFPHVRE